MSRVDGMCVQLCGPVTSLPREEAVAAFGRAVELLRASASCAVFSPTDAVPEDWTHERAMRRCLRWMIGYADAVVTLPGWEGSEGACLEVAVARAVGLPVMTLEEAVA